MNVEYTTHRTILLIWQKRTITMTFKCDWPIHGHLDTWIFLDKLVLKLARRTNYTPTNNNIYTKWMNQLLKSRKECHVLIVFCEERCTGGMFWLIPLSRDICIENMNGKCNLYYKSTQFHFHRTTFFYIFWDLHCFVTLERDE